MHPTQRRRPISHDTVGMWLGGFDSMSAGFHPPPCVCLADPCGAHSRRRSLTEPGGPIGSGSRAYMYVCEWGVNQRTKCQFEKFRILPSISVLLYIILSYGYSSKSGQDSQFLNYNIKVSAEQRPHESHPSYPRAPPPAHPIHPVPRAPPTLLTRAPLYHLQPPPCATRALSCTL